MVLRLTISNFNFLYLDVWDAMASTSGQDKTLLQCKKCGDAHSKPINAKCEKVKETKDEKKDGSKEHVSAKKTPRTKSCDGNNDKVLDLIMSTMSTFTAKLNAMEARLTGLSSRVEGTPVQPEKRKSRSRNKAKRIEISDEEEDVNLQTATFHPIVTLEDGTTYTQVFLDTAVMSKINATPASAKKSKQDIDLGVAPLQVPAAKNLDRVYEHSAKALPCTTATISRLPPGFAAPVWSTTATQPTPAVAPNIPTSMTFQETGQTSLQHTDQFGNPVRVFTTVDNITPHAGPQHDLASFVPPEVPRESTIQPGMDALKANPYIQQLVEQRFSLLEAKMKNELSHGNNHKKSGRYNTADTSCAPPHLKWPNESCLTRSV